jgi:hypothetical protein
VTRPTFGEIETGYDLLNLHPEEKCQISGTVFFSGLIKGQASGMDSQFPTGLAIKKVYYRGLAVTSRDDVIDERPPYWRYFFTPRGKF